MTAPARWLEPFAAILLAVAGCTGGSGSEPCVDVTGVWDLSLTGLTSGGLACPTGSRVWTLAQAGCTVTISAQAFETANGAVGTVSGDRLFVRWTGQDGCAQTDEEVDATVSGSNPTTLSGQYFFARGRVVYPSFCQGLGLCSSALAGSRRPP
jgi:hypothetical protein